MKQLLAASLFGLLAFVLSCGDAKITMTMKVFSTGDKFGLYYTADGGDTTIIGSSSSQIIDYDGMYYYEADVDVEESITITAIGSETTTYIKIELYEDKQLLKSVSASATTLEMEYVIGSNDDTDTTDSDSSSGT